MTKSLTFLLAFLLAGCAPSPEEIVARAKRCVDAGMDYQLWADIGCPELGSILKAPPGIRFRIDPRVEAPAQATYAEPTLRPAEDERKL